MATPNEMLERLTHALAAPGRRKAVAMTLSVPTILGHRGTWVGSDQYGPEYGYTRAQCQDMHDTIRAALDENARDVVRAAVEHPEADRYTGDVT